MSGREGGLIVALDVDVARARALVEAIGADVDFYKVPPALVLEDPDLLGWLRGRGKRVFFDGKWHDIPTQTARSVEAAGKGGVTACTVHAGGGRAMLKAALAASPRPWVWAVTVLTSFGPSDLKDVGLEADPAAQVLRLALLARDAGVDGLVCSPQEAGLLRRKGVALPLVTPGISWGGGAAPDQKRTATPKEAWSAGADWIVVGRSVLDAADPAAAARDILKERP